VLELLGLAAHVIIMIIVVLIKNDRRISAIAGGAAEATYTNVFLNSSILMHA
jgi:hypothetical protein